MLAAVDAEIDARRRQAVCSWPRRENQARSLGPVPGRALTRVVNDGCRVGKTTDPQGGSNQGPPTWGCAPGPRGSYAPPGASARKRAPTPVPPLLSTRTKGGGSLRAGLATGKGKADLSLRVGEAWCGQTAGLGGQPGSRRRRAGLSTLPGRLTTPLSRWGRGSAPSDPARGRFGASCWRVLRTE